MTPRGMVKVPASAATTAAAGRWLRRASLSLQNRAPSLLSDPERWEADIQADERLAVWLERMSGWQRTSISLRREDLMRLVTWHDVVAFVPHLLPTAGALSFLRACRLAGHARVGRPRLDDERLNRRIFEGPAQPFRDARELRRLKKRARQHVLLDAWLDGIQDRGETLLTYSVPPPPP